jgi:GNAT superfamily N-acetyltransferase
LRQFEKSEVAGLGHGAAGREVRLRDGTAVTFRPVRSTDVAALRAFVQGLSAESRYLRFHASVSDFSAAEWNYFASVDGFNHVAVIAWIGADIVGVGRYIRLKQAGDKAEVAFAVTDALQRRGLGTLLLAELVALAARSGVRQFRAEVLSGNSGIRGLLLGSSLRVVSDGDGAIEVALEEAAASVA